MTRLFCAEVDVVSHQDPIELPSLAQARRGPSAAVCRSGHVLAWLIDAGLAPKHCAKCGEAILVACPACNAALPADGEMLQWVPYHGNCTGCSAAYPWKAADIARAKRALAEQAEAESWSAEIKARADELVDDIAADRATASSVVSALHWIEHRGVQSATATILDAVDRLASATLRQGLRPAYPGTF